MFTRTDVILTQPTHHVMLVYILTYILLHGGRNTDNSGSNSPRSTDMSLLPELAEEAAGDKVVIDLEAPPDTRLRTSESLPPSPTVAPDNMSERLSDSAAEITPGGKVTPPPSPPASEPANTSERKSRASSPPERLSKTPSKLSVSL